jgi:hypothetical protein
MPESESDCRSHAERSEKSPGGGESAHAAMTRPRGGQPCPHERLYVRRFLNAPRHQGGAYLLLSFSDARAATRSMVSSSSCVSSSIPTLPTHGDRDGRPRSRRANCESDPRARSNSEGPSSATPSVRLMHGALTISGNLRFGGQRACSNRRSAEERRRAFRSLLRRASASCSGNSSFWGG